MHFVKTIYEHLVWFIDKGHCKAAILQVLYLKNSFLHISPFKLRSLKDLPFYHQNAAVLDIC